MDTNFVEMAANAAGLSQKSITALTDTLNSSESFLMQACNAAGLSHETAIELSEKMKAESERVIDSIFEKAQTCKSLAEWKTRILEELKACGYDTCKLEASFKHLTEMPNEI